jgi:starch synthase
MSRGSVPTVALLPWGELFDEDFLDTIGVSLEAFRDSFVGSWMFGYIDALRTAGVQTVIFCTSRRVTAPLRFVHAPTGARVCILPAAGAYRALRAHMRDPHGMTIEQMFGDVAAFWRPVAAALQQLAPYLATPLLSLARELKRERCDAILCQQHEYARFDIGVLLGRLLGVPVFASYQGGGDRQHSAIEHMLRPRTLKHSTGLIVATRSEAQRLQLRYDVPPRKIARIFNPVNLARWRVLDRDSARAELGIPTEARVVAWHGRIEIAQKGLDILVDAWDRICHERPGQDLRLVLMGTGNDADELRHRIAEAKLPGVCWLDQFVHDRAVLQRHLSAADVYAFPSRAEGFPVSPIEAMACGIPVVAADAEGVTDIFEDGENSGGLVVDREDPAALATALGRVIDDPNWGRELGRRARRRVEECFSLETVGEQLRAFLLSNTEQRSKREAALPVGIADEHRRAQSPLLLRSISPEQTPVGVGFSSQPDGQSALSVTADGADRATLVALGKRLLVTTYANPRFLTALVPKSVLRRPRQYPVYLTDGVRRSNRLMFTVSHRDHTKSVVRPAPASKLPLLHGIEPTSTRAGQGFSLQPGGCSGLSVRCENAGPGTVVVFGGRALETTYGGPTWLTAEVPPDLYAEPGNRDVYLTDGTGESLPMEFVVEP